MFILELPDLATQMGRSALTNTETGRALLLARNAELYLRAKGIDTKAADEETLQLVIRTAVAAEMSGPGAGVNTVEVTVDDGSIRKLYDNADSGPTAMMGVLDSMLWMLTPSDADRPSGAFTIHLGGPRHLDHHPGSWR